MTSHDTVGIGAAARVLGTTERTLRYYEQRGLLTPPAANAAGHRRYDQAALSRARQLLALRELGLPLGSIAKILDQDVDDDLTAALTIQAHRIDNDVSNLIALHDRVTQMLAAAPLSVSTDEALDLLEELATKIVLTRIYTRTGDDGTTALARGVRVDKTDTRLEVMGDVDELITAIGVALAATESGHGDLLRSIQNDLFDLGADLASSGGWSGANPATQLVRSDYIARLEQACDAVNAELDPPSSFVLPGSNTSSAALHHARAICRRAERHAWAAPDTPEASRRYLNRLADLLFILARAAETEAEPTWAPSTHQPAGS